MLGGYPAGLAVARALAPQGVQVICVWHERAEVGRRSRHVDRCVESPDPVRAEGEYVKLLEEIADQTAGGVLMPTSDEAVGAVARHRDGLADAFRVACVGWPVAERCLDKARTYALADELGVATPATLEIGSLAELEAARERIVFPSVVKPRRSHLYYRRFRSKMALVDDFDALLAAWRDADSAGLEMLVQEFVPGDDTHGVNYNAYVVDGVAVAETTAQKLRLAPPRTGFPCAIVSREIPEIIEPARRLLAGMGYEGFANVEFKRDERDGVYKLMEVNGRPNYSNLLSLRVGVNFPWIAYSHLVYGSVPERPPRQRNGVFWIALPADAIRAGRGQRPRLAELTRPYRGPHVFELWDARDPWPFATGIATGTRLRLGRLGARVRRSASSLARGRRAADPIPAKGSDLGG